MMIVQEVPMPLIDRLFAEHQSSENRVNKLFPSLTGQKWKPTLKDLSKQSELDFVSTESLYVDVTQARNQFLHAGLKWSIPDNMPQLCIENIWPLINLFVALHNRFVVKEYQTRGKVYHMQAL
jgi:hypothetical protein